MNEDMLVATLISNLRGRIIELERELKQSHYEGRVKDQQIIRLKEQIAEHEAEIKKLERSRQFFIDIAGSSIERWRREQDRKNNNPYPDEFYNES